jgi:hypothetical protein
MELGTTIHVGAIGVLLDLEWFHLRGSSFDTSRATSCLRRKGVWGRLSPRKRVSPKEA